MVTKKTTKSKDIPYVAPAKENFITGQTQFIDYVWDKLGKEQAIDLSLLDITKLMVPNKFTIDSNCISNGTFLALYDDTASYWSVADNGTSTVPDRVTTIVFDWGKIREVRNFIITYAVVMQPTGAGKSVRMQVDVSNDGYSWESVWDTTTGGNSTTYYDIILGQRSFKYMSWTITIAGTTIGQEIRFYEMKGYL